MNVVQRNKQSLAARKKREEDPGVKRCKSNEVVTREAGKHSSEPFAWCGHGLFDDVDATDLNKSGLLEETFERFWKSVTTSIENQPSSSVPQTPVDEKIATIQRRVKMNQTILDNANARMKTISFDKERQFLLDFQASEMHMGDPPRVENLETLQKDLEELRQHKSSAELFLKSSPGIADFQSTMETTLNLLSKVQRQSDLVLTDQDIQNDFSVTVIKAPTTDVVPE